MTANAGLCWKTSPYLPYTCLHPTHIYKIMNVPRHTHLIPYLTYTLHACISLKKCYILAKPEYHRILCERQNNQVHQGSLCLPGITEPEKYLRRVLPMGHYNSGHQFQCVSGFSHTTTQFSDTSRVSYNSIQFWRYLCGDSIRSHRLRAESPMATNPPFQTPITSPNYHLYFWKTSYSLAVSMIHPLLRLY